MGNKLKSTVNDSLTSLAKIKKQIYFLAVLIEQSALEFDAKSIEGLGILLEDLSEQLAAIEEDLELLLKT